MAFRHRAAKCHRARPSEERQVNPVNRQRSRRFVLALTIEGFSRSRLGDDSAALCGGAGRCHPKNSSGIPARESGNSRGAENRSAPSGSPGPVRPSPARSGAQLPRPENQPRERRGSRNPQPARRHRETALACGWGGSALPIRVAANAGQCAPEWQAGHSHHTEGVEVRESNQKRSAERTKSQIDGRGYGLLDDWQSGPAVTIERL